MSTGAGTTRSGTITSAPTAPSRSHEYTRLIDAV